MKRISTSVIFTVWGRKFFKGLALLGILFLAVIATRGSVTQAQDEPPYIGEVRIFDPEFMLPNAAGLTYSPVADTFLLLADRRPPQTSVHADNLTVISPFADLIGSISLPPVANPINMTFDQKANRLLLFDTTNQELITIGADLDGAIEPAAVNRFSVQQFGIQDPQGMAVDPLNGTLFILNAANSSIVRIDPDQQGNFDGAAALAEGRVLHINLSEPGLGTLRGLAFNPASGRLFSIDPVAYILYEFSQTGHLEAIRDMTSLDLGFRDPQGIVFAPSADSTDDPTQLHLYLMDSGRGPLSTEPIVEVQEIPHSFMSCQKDTPFTGAGAGRHVEHRPARIIELTLTQPAAVSDQSK